jgi:signal peptidase II
MMLGLAGIIVLLDQGTKHVISQVQPYFQVIPGFFSLTYVKNTGAAFGILRGKQPLLAAVSVVAMGVLLFLLFYEHEKRKGLLYAFALILGGTCGNFIDRVRLGYVIDFLDFHIQQHHWPTFNVADSAISIGVGLLILVTLREGERAKVS